MENGLAVSLARPGGNVTGVVRLSSELLPKNLELLHEMVPGARRIALLVDPGSPSIKLSLEQAGRAAQALGIELGVVEARTVDDFDAVCRQAWASSARARCSRREVGCFLSTAPGWWR